MHLVHVKTHKNKHIYSFKHIVTMFSSIKKQCIRLGQSHIILSSLGVGPAPPVNVVVVPVVVLSVDPVVVLSVLSVTVVVVLEVRSRHSCSTPFLVIFWSLQVSKNLKSIVFFYSSTFLFLQGVHLRCPNIGNEILNLKIIHGCQSLGSHSWASSGEVVELLEHLCLVDDQPFADASYGLGLLGMPKNIRLKTRNPKSCIWWTKYCMMYIYIWILYEQYFHMLRHHGCKAFNTWMSCTSSTYLKTNLV